MQKLKVSPNPKLPTADEVEEHRLVHIPYRCWCKWCVMGRGRGHPHVHSLDSWIAIVGLDYFFITQGGVKRRDELEFTRDAPGNMALDEARQKGEIAKCILLRCFKTKVVLAHVVPTRARARTNTSAASLWQTSSGSATRR